MPLIVGFSVGGAVVVSGATCPGAYCLHEEPVRWTQRSDIPAAWEALPMVLMMTLRPLLPVWNQSAATTLAGQLSGLRPRVASATTVCGLVVQRGCAVARTQIALLPLAS